VLRANVTAVRDRERIDYEQFDQARSEIPTILGDGEKPKAGPAEVRTGLVLERVDRRCARWCRRFYDVKGWTVSRHAAISAWGCARGDGDGEEFEAVRRVA